MRIYLFGGAETALGEVPKELKLIEQVIKESGARQVLHIPFARPVAHEPEWEGDWYHRYIDLPNVEYLNAEKEEDLARADKPLVFISGGSESGLLLEKINSNKRLLEIIKKTDIVIGESGGAKILGAFARIRNAKGEREVVPGLNLVPNSVIEPHFSSQNRNEVLADTMRAVGAKCGIGVDTVTAILVDPESFPEKYKKVGDGNVFVKNSNHDSLEIAHVVSTFYPRHGGMGVVAFDEASELAKRGHTVSVFTMRYGGDARIEEKNGFTVKRLQAFFRIGDGGIVYFGGRFKNFDVVHLHLPWYGSAFLAYISLRLSKKPYVVTLHMEGSLKGIKKIYKKIADLIFLPCILKKAKKVFVVNKNYFATAKYLSKIHPDKIIELPNPIDTALFFPGAKDTEIFKHLLKEHDKYSSCGAGMTIECAGLHPKQNRVILFVGNLLPLKRLDLLLRAMAAGDASWRLAVVGSGYAETEYKKMVKELGLEEKVTFFGSIERTELPKFYRAADCVVVPSESESFSLVAAEAMACGVPVVISSVPGAGEQVLNGAVGFESGNVDSLVQAIQVALNLDTTKPKQSPFSLENHLATLENTYLT